jgi:hypothetical protein
MLLPEFGDAVEADRWGRRVADTREGEKIVS